MNKCAKFHKDSPSDNKVKFDLPSAIELSETAVFVYNFVWKPYASKQLRWHIWPTFPLNFFMKFSQKMPLYFFYTMVQKSFYFGKTMQLLPWPKNRYSRDIQFDWSADSCAIMRYHATSTSICNASSWCADQASRVDVELKLDIARYHMIELQINLMNFSAVTIFLARVVPRLVF